MIEVVIVLTVWLTIVGGGFFLLWNAGNNIKDFKLLLRRIMPTKKRATVKAKIIEPSPGDVFGFDKEGTYSVQKFTVSYIYIAGVDVNGDRKWLAKNLSNDNVAVLEPKSEYRMLHKSGTVVSVSLAL